MKKISLFLAALACLAVIGCEKPDPARKPTPGPDPTHGGGGEEGGNNGGGEEQKDDKPFFTADIPSEYNVTSPEQGWNYMVSTNIPDWTAESDAAWCRTNIIKGQENNCELNIIVDGFEPRTENGDYDYCQPRVCTVTIKAGSIYSHSLTVRQESKVRMTTGLYGKPVLLDPAGETRQIYILTNCISWTPSTDADWLTVKRIDNATLELTSTARKDSGQARTTTVTVVSDLDSWSSTSRTSFTVADTDASLSGDDYGYGDHIDWE